MAVKKTTCFCINTIDKPGVLADLARTLAKNRVNLKGLVGYGIGGGKAVLHAMPNNPGAFKKVAAKAGWKASPCDIFHLSGKDKVGALIQIAEAAEKAKVNIAAVYAVAVGGKFASFVWPVSGMEKALAKALKAR